MLNNGHQKIILNVILEYKTHCICYGGWDTVIFEQRRVSYMERQLLKSFRSPTVFKELISYVLLVLPEDLVLGWVRTYSVYIFKISSTYCVQLTAIFSCLWRIVWIFLTLAAWIATLIIETRSYYCLKIHKFSSKKISITYWFLQIS